MSQRKLSAAAIIFDHSDHVLMGYKIKDAAWEFPGGKAEGDEPIMDTAVRELNEETGLFIPQLKYVGYYDKHSSWLVHMFTGITPEFGMGPKLREPDKHTHWDWFMLSSLTIMKLTEHAQGVVDLGFTLKALSIVCKPIEYEGIGPATWKGVTHKKV